MKKKKSVLLGFVMNSYIGLFALFIANVYLGLSLMISPADTSEILGLMCVLFGLTFLIDLINKYLEDKIENLKDKIENKKS